MLQHLETNLHRLSSPVNILIFRKSISKLHFFGLLSRSVRALIINISSSKVPTNTVDIHSVRNVCKLVIIFHPSWQDLCHNVDHPFENPPERVQKLTMASNSKYSTHLAHAQTKCPCAQRTYMVYASGADLGGGCRGCAPLPEMTYSFLIQLVFCKKRWFIRVSYAIS